MNTPSSVKKDKDCGKNEECLSNSCKQKYVDGEGEVIEYCTRDDKCKSKSCDATRYICVDDDSSARPKQKQYHQECKLNKDCNTFEECRDQKRCSIRGRCHSDYHCKPGFRCDSTGMWCMELRNQPSGLPNGPPGGNEKPSPVGKETSLPEETRGTNENDADTTETNSSGYFPVSKALAGIMLLCSLS